MIALQQPLGELRVVGQAGLPHQRRVRREARRCADRRPAPGSRRGRRRRRRSGWRSRSSMRSTRNRLAAGQLLSPLADDCRHAPRTGRRLSGRRAASAAACGRCLAARSAPFGIQPPARRRRRRRCRRSSRTRTGRARAPPPPRAACPGAGLRHSHGPRSSGMTPSGWCRQRRKPSKRTPSASSSSRTRSCTCEQLLESRSFPWLPPAGWRPDQDEPRVGQAPRRRRRAGQQPHVARLQRRLGQPESESGTSALSTPSRSRKAARRRLTVPWSRRPRGSPSARAGAASSGCETSACQTTA